MDYITALEKIHSYDKFGTRLGLERVSALLCALGSPHKKLRFVHIAGTNGKGSVSTMLSEILQIECKRVGLYTSPYITDFRERMQINGEMIRKSELVRLAETVFAAVETLDDTPTEFELITALAMLYFAENACDIVVLEVGLGGMYDATNVIEMPLVSVITSISFDHTEYLGDTLAEIARNKAGIIKEGGKTVLAYGQAPEVVEVMKSAAREKHNTLHICQNKTRQYNGRGFFYQDKLYELSMLGFHQLQNAVTAIETAKLLGCSDTAIFKGIKAARLPARMEPVSREPAIILDGAHNPDGIEMLCRTVRHFFSGKKIIAVVAMMADKRWQESVLKIESIADEMIATKASNPRSLAPQVLGEYLHCAHFDSPREALRAAREMADENTVILVCGSLYLAADVRSLF